MPFVKDQGKESLNFQITLSIVFFIGTVLLFIGIGIIVPFAVAIIGFVLVIMASVKANDGIPYRYPFKIDVIKWEEFVYL